MNGTVNIHLFSRKMIQLVDSEVFFLFDVFAAFWQNWTFTYSFQLQRKFFSFVLQANNRQQIKHNIVFKLNLPTVAHFYKNFSLMFYITFSEANIFCCYCQNKTLSH